MTPSRRLAGLASLLLVTAVTTACQDPRTWYEVRLRDPSSVSVEVETPHGRRAVLPPGKEEREETLPRTTPPYGGAVLFEASAIRAETGAITLRCDACLRAPVVHAVPANGAIDLTTTHLDERDTPELTWTDDALRVHMAHPYSVPAGRSTLGPYTAFRYDLSIPRQELLDVHKKREDLHADGVTALFIGIGLTAATTALTVWGASRLGGPDDDAGWGTLSIIGASLLLAPTLLVDWLAVAELTGPGGYDVRLGP